MGVQRPIRNGNCSTAHKWSSRAGSAAFGRYVQFEDFSVGIQLFAHQGGTSHLPIPLLCLSISTTTRP